MSNESTSSTGAATITPERTRFKRRDLRLPLIVAGLTAIAGTGYLVSLIPGRGVETAPLQRKTAPAFPAIAEGAAKTPAAEESVKYEALADPRSDPGTYARQMREIELRQKMRQAESLLAAKRYAQALAALQRVLQLQPDKLDAHVKTGFALIGLEQYRPAYQHLMHAIDRDPSLADAYFGIAMVQEAEGNLEGALGGMRAFLHLTPDPDPARLQIAQARAAIWEWEAKLGRGPWGPTRGIPPGFTQAELRRDGKGVATKMPTRIPVGDEPVPYEIKSADKREIFKR